VTNPRLESLAAIARHCWRGTHWERAPGEHPRHVKEPLKFPHLEKHLGDGPYVGLAPIVPGESSTRIAVLDFDSHKGEVSFDTMRQLAENVRRVLSVEKLVAPIMFRSSGGQGIHLIMLWDEPQDAYSVRELLASALSECGLKNGTKGMKNHEVEIFPKQDSVELDGFGSMFILPFAGKSELLDGVITAEWPKSQPVPGLTKPVDTVQKDSTIDPASLPTSLADIRSALAAIPNEGSESLEYDSWRNLIFALHHATGGSAEGLALAHEFSSRSGKYEPAFLDERVWPYVRSERGGNIITERTLFDLARKHGYVEDCSLDFEDLDAAGREEPKSVADTPAGVPASAPAALRFAVIPAHRFADRKPQRWIIRGVVPRAETVTIIGEPGSGKSFIALDLAGAVARGIPWRDHKVTPGRAVYVAAEGATGFRNRLVAYARHHNLSLDQLQIGVISEAPNLLKKDDARDLVLAVRAFGSTDLVVVDTLAQSMPGGDENSGEDVGKVLGHCRAIHKHTGATVVLVHHVGKDKSRGARGWSGILGAVDAEITIDRDAAGREARISKMKDGEDGAVYPFRLNVIPIGEDEDGEVIDSCVVDHLDASSSGPRREPKSSTQKAVWRAAHDLVLLGDESVPMEALLQQAIKDMAYDPAKRDRRRDLATRAVQQLQDDGFLTLVDGQIRVKSA
jgi:hypothetical protein